MELTQHSPSSAAIVVPPQLSVSTMHALRVAFEAAVACPDAHTIVLQSASDKIFSEGMSFHNLGVPREKLCAAVEDFAALLARIHASPKPTVAVVRGRALGGGAGIALACDTVLACENASFGFPEMLFGLFPGIVLPFVLQRLPPQKARRLIVLGGSITAQEAFRLGMVDIVASAGDLERQIRAELKALSRVRTGMVAQAKSLVANALVADVDVGVSLGKAVLQQKLTDPNVLAEIEAFTQYGDAPWKQMSHAP